MAVTTYATETFPEEGVRTAQVAFKDEDGVAVAPNSASWTLYNRPSDPTETPTVINSREDVVISSPEATEDILLEGDDLAFLAAELGTLCHRALVVEYQYDSSFGNNLDDKIQYFFSIERIIGV